MDVVAVLRVAKRWCYINSSHRDAESRRTKIFSASLWLCGKSMTLATPAVFSDNRTFKQCCIINLMPTKSDVEYQLKEASQLTNAAWSALVEREMGKWRVVEHHRLGKKTQLSLVKFLGRGEVDSWLCGAVRQVRGLRWSAVCRPDRRAAVTDKPSNSVLLC